MNKPKIALLGIALALACVVFPLRRPLRFLALARAATAAEIQILLGEPHYLLSPTGWHATPTLTRGYVHRWKARTPVGTWYGYYKNRVAEGWVRCHFDFDGARIGGYTYFDAGGRILYQWIPQQPSQESPPWLWGECDLTRDEMAYLVPVAPQQRK